MKTIELYEGLDLTDILKIQKYDPESLEEQKLTPKRKQSGFNSFMFRYRYLRLIYLFFQKIFGRTRQSYAWPSWAQKSDETRAQVLQYVYDKYQGVPFVATEKYDGQSALFGIYKKKFVVCSRNINLKKGKSNYWDYAIEHDVEGKLRKAVKELRKDIYIQGELVGTGIQANKYKLENRRFFVFNIRSIESGEFWSNEAISEFCKAYGFERVPVLETFVFNFKSIEELLKYADGYSVLNSKTLREGVVLRPVTQMPPDRGQSNMCSFKVISPSFDITYKGD